MYGKPIWEGVSTVFKGDEDAQTAAKKAGMFDIKIGQFRLLAEDGSGNTAILSRFRAVCRTNPFTPYGV